MNIIAVVLFLHISTIGEGKIVKKFKDESAILNKKLINKPKPYSPPAIIAIEIVDPNENKTSKNSKRTIDSSLGYGYQSSPKYEVYKYSQHDIPPYRSHPVLFTGGSKAQVYDIQKSISYNLPSQTYQAQNYYQPGTTLYSTINHLGQVENLSSNLPSSHNEPQVPVIILKVYPSQLNDPSAALHSNLPQSHPYASVVNSIDIQSLLNKYVHNGQQNYQYQQPSQNYQHQQQQDYQYQYDQPQSSYHYQYEQPQNNYQYQQQDIGYNAQNGDGLLSHENYPTDSHTRVVFRTDKNKLGVNPNKETKTIQIAIPEGSYSSVQVETDDMQYGYTNPGDGSASQYYYQQQPDYPESGYQQIDGQQHGDDASPSEIEKPYNYHAHQKRSKKVQFSTSREDEIRLQPIKA